MSTQASTQVPAPLQAWHALVAERSMKGLNALLADDVVFYSPVVHTPQAGKPITAQYLYAAFNVFFNDSFRYVRETIGADHAILEFEVQIEGIQVNGIDMITWNADGKITAFKVMVRPLKAIQLIHQQMAAMLEAQKAKAG